MEDDYLKHVGTHVACGAAVGAVFGTYEAIKIKFPGLMKIRCIGPTTVATATVFGIFLGAGNLIHCGKSD